MSLPLVLVVVALLLLLLLLLLLSPPSLLLLLLLLSPPSLLLLLLLLPLLLLLLPVQLPPLLRVALLPVLASLLAPPALPLPLIRLLPRISPGQVGLLPEFRSLRRGSVERPPRVGGGPAPAGRSSVSRRRSCCTCRACAQKWPCASAATSATYETRQRKRARIGFFCLPARRGSDDVRVNGLRELAAAPTRPPCPPLLLCQDAANVRRVLTTAPFGRKSPPCCVRREGVARPTLRRCLGPTGSHVAFFRGKQGVRTWCSRRCCTSGSC